MIRDGFYKPIGTLDALSFWNGSAMLLTTDRESENVAMILRGCRRRRSPNDSNTERWYLGIQTMR